MRLWLVGFVVGLCVLQFVNCEEKIKLANKKVKPLQSCGPSKMKKGITRRVLGGTFVTPKEQALYKHQVRIVSHAPNHEGSLGCGGSLIAPNWVITAAHCFDDEEYQVDKAALYFGITNLKERNNAQTRYVFSKDFHFPDGWDPESILNLHDIALVYIKDPVKLDDKVGVISFPAFKSKCGEYETKKVTVSGWGMTDDNELTENNILKAAEVTVTDVKDCRKTWGGGFDPNTMICTSASTYEGTCEGDSGGPIVHNSLLIGVTSFGMPACVSKDPRIFTCAVAHKLWIHSTTGLTLFK